MLNQRRCRNLDNDVVDADLEIPVERVDTFTHFRRAVHLDLGGEKEVWYRSRRNESLRNRLSNLIGWLVAISGRADLRDLTWFDGAR